MSSPFPPILDHITVPVRDYARAKALAAGGKDFGAPGLRPHYHPGYYGAFVLDPDGHDLEAVHHSFVGRGAPST